MYNRNKIHTSIKEFPPKGFSKLISFISQFQNRWETLKALYKSLHKNVYKPFQKNFNLSPKLWMMNMKRNEVLYCLKDTDHSLRKISMLPDSPTFGIYGISVSK